MVAVVDYGVGNLFSLVCSLKAIGAEAVVTSDPDILRGADRIILPGVGAFGDAAAKLRESGLDRVLIELAGSGKPLLGICLGMQLLFEESLEFGLHKGLGLIPGRVVPMAGVIPGEFKIPHMGWNSLIFKSESPLLKYTAAGDCVYFVHSFYAADCTASLVASAEYGAELTAMVQNGNVYGCQFHPEKSGTVGLKILKAFCEVEAC